jgi:glucose/arabinose dehydrogenase/mono/diheme cytochrome c family protein
MKKIFSFSFVTLFFLLFFSSCGPSKSEDTIPTDSLSISKGGDLFQSHCSSCHNFKQDGIGPDLSGITNTDSISWLQKFISNPKNMAASGDAHTKNLLDKFHVLMPSFDSLTGSQIVQLLSYLRTQPAHKKKKEDPLAIKDPVPEKISPSHIIAPLKLFAEMPPTSDKEPHTRISKMDWVAAEKSWFVLDQRGILYKMVNGNPVIWLDISKWKPKFINEPGLATGFGCFIFHPDFAKNGIFYTTHSEAPHSKKADFSIPDSVKQTLQWVLCEWKITNPRATVFNGTNRELLRIDMVQGIHGVQEIIFNPRSKLRDEDFGNLYIGVGDGGSVEDGYRFLTNHPQKIWGTILRINPLGNNSANGQYGIPATNPFFNNSDPNTVREIYAEGFRNPNRITWTGKGLMLATNIGQANIEALDIIQKGNDYGWPIREGAFAIHPDADVNNIYALPANDSIYHIHYPVAVFDHDEGNAIEGGYEYSGKAIPELKGKYVFGDIPSGRLFYVALSDLKPGKLATVKEWFVSLNGKIISLRELCGQNRVDLRFAKDDQGELYISTKPDGKIYKLTH